MSDQKYPHDALVRAWLDGKTLQYLDGDVWIDIAGRDTADKMPHLYRTGTDYRVKPVTVRYRVALFEPVGMAGSYSAVATSSLVGERELRACDGFVRWLTDWTEVQA